MEWENVPKWSITKAKRHFEEVFSAAASGKPQIITRNGIPVAVLIPHTDTETERTPYDDPRFSGITYHIGQAGIPTPILRGTGILVQTIVVACHRQGQTVEYFAAEREITEGQVVEALAFYSFHNDEVDLLIRLDDELEQQLGQTEFSPELLQMAEEVITRYKIALEKLRRTTNA